MIEKITTKPNHLLNTELIDKINEIIEAHNELLKALQAETVLRIDYTKITNLNKDE